MTKAFSDLNTKANNLVINRPGLRESSNRRWVARSPFAEWHNSMSTFCAAFLHPAKRLLTGASKIPPAVTERTHVPREARWLMSPRAHRPKLLQKVCTGVPQLGGSVSKEAGERALWAPHSQTGAGARGRCCERRQVAARCSDRPWSAAPPPWAAPARPFCDLPKVPPDAVQDACVARTAVIKEPLWRVWMACEV